MQRDPTNAAAWFELGVKQQENEREAKAIQALQCAVDLDPSHLPTWLALSVSYTNDGNRLGAYDAIRQWVLRHSQYETIVSGTGLATDARGDFAGLIDVLIRMARSADQREGGVDADVQVALAVLLNTTEVRLFFKSPPFSVFFFFFLPNQKLFSSSGLCQSGGLFPHGVGGSTRCTFATTLVCIVLDVGWMLGLVVV